MHFVESDAECLDRCQEEDTSKIQLTNGIANASNQQLAIKGNTSVVHHMLIIRVSVLLEVEVEIFT